MNDECLSVYNWCGSTEGDEGETLQQIARINGLKKPRNPKDMTLLEWVHERFDNYTELDRKLQWKLQDEWEKLQGGFESSEEDTYHPIEDVPEANNNELIEELDEYLNVDHYFKSVDKDEESFKKRKCQLLGTPYEKPPTFTAEIYKVVKYSLGPNDEFVAIKTIDYKELDQTEENVAMLYGNIFRIKDEGWHVTRTK